MRLKPPERTPPTSTPRPPRHRTTKLTDRRPEDDVMMATSIDQPDAQVEVESGAAVRVERLSDVLTELSA